MNDLEWEGAWDEESRPDLITCPACGAKLRAASEEYLVGPKKGLFFAVVPAHYPQENQPDWWLNGKL